MITKLKRNAPAELPCVPLPDGNVLVPVLNRFPVGHVRYNATLPVGAMAELDADAQTLRLLENPVTLP